VAGFHGMVVPTKEVERLIPKREKRVQRLEQDSSGMVSAAAFGRSIGLRDHGNFHALIEAGHVPARQVRNETTGRLQYFLGVDEIASFHRRFVTLTTLAAETGKHRNTLRGLLGRLAHFSPEGRDFGPVYLRTDVSKVLRQSLP
jgi:hypothetical protein